MSILLLSDFSLFIGRFHPLLVHLPIGFLLLAALMEWWPGGKLRPAIRISWVLGAVAAVAAAGCGWLLAAESGGGNTLWWHRWLGISVAGLAVAGVFLTREGGRTAKATGLVTVVLLSVAGHQGGNLTHGETYLVEHAPPLVQKIAGHEPRKAGLVDWSTRKLDSINVYATFLQPALETGCVKCHNAGKQNGGLRMDEPHRLFAGGDSGPLLHAGDAAGSLWMTRVTLPRDNVKAMPPQGPAWDYTTIALLEYWIDSGADTLAVLDPRDTPEALKALLLRDYGLDLRPRLFVENLKAEPLSAASRERLENLNWRISEAAPGTAALSVRVAPGEAITAEAIIALSQAAAEQTAYLQLDRLPLTDADLEPLSKLRNLNRLRLNGTRITDATVHRLATLPHLESLNLYDTEVTDAALEALATYPSLKRLYLWQTQVSSAAVNGYATAKPQVAVDTGFVFQTPRLESSK